MKSRGFYAQSKIGEMVSRGRIFSDYRLPISKENIQPASYEARIGNEVYVNDRADRFSENQGEKRKLTDGFILEPGFVYRVRYIERLNLSPEERGFSNPKSRSGRAGINVRLIADDCPEAYDVIPAGYRGPISAEITCRRGRTKIAPYMPLNQIRFANAPFEEIQFSAKDIIDYILKYRARPNPTIGVLENRQRVPLVNMIFDREGNEAPLDKIDFCGNAIVLHYSNSFPNDAGVVSYVAKKTKKILDIRKGKTNRLERFFKPISLDGIKSDEFVVDPSEFFLSSSAEILHCPPDLLMVTRPIDPRYGDVKGDHAGFIDPRWFGTITFEPIVYENVPFVFRTWQPMMGVLVSPVIGKVFDEYGKNQRNFHYGQVGVKAGPFYS
ncbi:MAG: 2'-deoxycytidine 5'-triphosphate deaminase [Candidatus Pacearchaeota archaeon]